MGLIQSPHRSLRRRTSARSAARPGLALERFDERIAPAVDQFRVDPGSPLSSLHATGARTDPFPSLTGAQAAIRSRLAKGTRVRDIVVNRVAQRFRPSSLPRSTHINAFGPRR